MAIDPTSDPDPDPSSVSISPAKIQYRSGEDGIIVIRGLDEHYELDFLAWVLFRPEPNSMALLDLVVLANEGPEPFDEFRFDRDPEQIRRHLIDKRIEQQLDSSGIDNKIIYDKIEQFFNHGPTARELARLMRDESADEVEEFLKKQLMKQIFSLAREPLEIHLLGQSSEMEQSDTPAATTAPSVSESSTEPSPVDSSHFVVSACVKPFLGTEIGKLQPGDVLEVRVVGESARRLKNEYLDHAEPGDEPQSKPLNGRLISQEQGSTPQEIRFTVEIGEGLYGTGTIARGTRVSYKQQTVPVQEPVMLYLLRGLLFACSLFFLASLLLLAFVL